MRPGFPEVANDEKSSSSKLPSSSKHPTMLFVLKEDSWKCLVRVGPEAHARCGYWPRIKIAAGGVSRSARFLHYPVVIPSFRDLLFPNPSDAT